MRHGASFSIPAILSELRSKPWEEDTDGEGQIRRVWLGTIFGCTPSGKFYVPFACSNVAGDCPICGGSGERPEPRTGRRARKRAAQRTATFSRRTLVRLDYPAAWSAYMTRIATARGQAYAATSTTCRACHGHGSISAARDERWREHWEAAFDAVGIYFEYDGESYFASEWRETPDDADDADDELSDEEDELDPDAVAERIPADFPVAVLHDGEAATDRCTCGRCGLSWDDAISTSMTPTPSGRCPFEAFHEE